jgi:multidrug efflux pump subunit AcrA (membrane-fusion protein)
VVRVLASEHQSVAAQQELVEILSLRPLEIEVMAPSTWLAWLRPRLRFRVVVDEIGETFGARVVAVGAAVEPVSKMVLLRGVLEKVTPGLVPGMGAVAYFDRDDS